MGNCLPIVLHANDGPAFGVGFIERLVCRCVIDDHRRLRNFWLPALGLRQKRACPSTSRPCDEGTSTRVSETDRDSAIGLWSYRPAVFVLASFTQRKPRWLVPVLTSPLPRVPTM